MSAFDDKVLLLQHIFEEHKHDWPEGAGWDHANRRAGSLKKLNEIHDSIKNRHCSADR